MRVGRKLAPLPALLHNRCGLLAESPHSISTRPGSVFHLFLEFSSGDGDLQLRRESPGLFITARLLAWGGEEGA